MTTKRFLIALAGFGWLLSPLSAAALTPPVHGPGSLIKASGSSVYYYGQDGKRYVFPNEKTYNTWYTGFGSVITIGDMELSGIPLGGNVTYRPGVKLVKVTTDPRTYAVAAGGTLRHITSEAVARDLYGADWNTKVDDLPDPFFVNYRLGSAINSATDFAPTTETAFATSIGRDKGLDQPAPTPPPPPPPPTTSSTTSTTPTPSGRTGTLEISPSPASVNQTITLIASAMPSTGIWYVNVYFDGFHMRRCEFSPCGADVRTGTKPEYVAVAEFVWGDMQKAYVTTTVSTSAGSPGIQATVTRPEIRPDSQREVIVDVDSSFVAKTIDVYLDGSSVRGCNDVQQCRYTATETSPIGTVHTVYAIARDANGFTRQSATKTFSVVSNPRPLITVTPGKTTMYRGETIDVAVSATDDDGLNYTEITTSDGSFTKRCNGSYCTAQVIRGTAGTFQFIGTSVDMLGAMATASSSVITVQ